MVSFQPVDNGSEAHFEVLHSLLLFKNPRPLVGGPLDTIAHAPEDDLGDLET